MLDGPRGGRRPRRSRSRTIQRRGGPGGRGAVCTDAARSASVHGARRARWRENQITRRPRMRRAASTGTPREPPGTAISGTPRDTAPVASSIAAGGRTTVRSHRRRRGGSGLGAANHPARRSITANTAARAGFTLNPADGFAGAPSTLTVTVRVASRFSRRSALRNSTAWFPGAVIKTPVPLYRAQFPPSIRYSVQLNPHPRSVATNETIFPSVAFDTVATVTGGRSSTKTPATFEGSTPPRRSVAFHVIVCGPPVSVKTCQSAIAVHDPETTRYQIVGGPSPVRSGELNWIPVVGRMYGVAP